MGKDAKKGRYRLPPGRLHETWISCAYTVPRFLRDCDISRTVKYILCASMHITEITDNRDNVKCKSTCKSNLSRVHALTLIQPIQIQTSMHTYIHTCTAYMHAYFRLDARSINARSILHANAYNMLTCNNKWQSKVYRCQWPKTK